MADIVGIGARSEEHARKNVYIERSYDDARDVGCSYKQLKPSQPPFQLTQRVCAQNIPSMGASAETGRCKIFPRSKINGNCYLSGHQATNRDLPVLTHQAKQR